MDSTTYDDLRAEMDALRATIAALEADLSTPYTGPPVIDAAVPSELRASAAALLERSARGVPDAAQQEIAQLAALLESTARSAQLRITLRGMQDAWLADIRAMFAAYQRDTQRSR